MIDTTSIPGASSMTTSLSTAPGVTVLTVAGRTLRALTFMAMLLGVRTYSQDSTASIRRAGSRLVLGRDPADDSFGALKEFRRHRTPGGGGILVDLIRSR